MSHKARFARVCIVTLLGTLSSLGFARSAQASSDYPPALQAALDKEFPATKHCVPLCTACHNTTQGGPGNINVFGAQLEHFGLLPGNAALVDVALQQLAAASPPTDSDGDGTSDVDELNAGDSPSIAGPAGTGQFCPDITYGCGAHIAAAPPKDRLSLIPAALVALGLIAVRRRRPTVRARG